MKLLTKEIIKELEKRGFKEPYEDTDKVIAKFFNPVGSGTWYVLEGEEVENGNWIFFGFVDWHEKEWGNFSLHELEGARLPMGLTIERDRHYKGTYADLVALDRVDSRV